MLIRISIRIPGNRLEIAGGLLEAGAIGQPRSVAISLHRQARPELFDPQDLPWRVVPELSGSGIFVDMGSHTLDFLDYLFGPIRAVRGFAGVGLVFEPALADFSFQL